MSYHRYLGRDSVDTWNKDPAIASTYRSKILHTYKTEHVYNSIQQHNECLQTINHNQWRRPPFTKRML